MNMGISETAQIIQLSAFQSSGGKRIVSRRVPKANRGTFEAGQCESYPLSCEK
jgi:hypothetical protein